MDLSSTLDSSMPTSLFTCVYMACRPSHNIADLVPATPLRHLLEVAHNVHDNIAAGLAARLGLLEKVGHFVETLEQALLLLCRVRTSSSSMSYDDSLTSDLLIELVPWHLAERGLRDLELLREVADALLHARLQAVLSFSSSLLSLGTRLPMAPITRSAMLHGWACFWLSVGGLEACGARVMRVGQVLNTIVVYEKDPS